MNEQDQTRYLEGMALRDAAKSVEGQLYHKHVRRMMDDLIDRMLAVPDDAPDQIIVSLTRQLQGVWRCLEAEGDSIQKGLQLGARLNDKARVPR